MNFQFQSKIAVETPAKRGLLQILCLIGAGVLIVLNAILVAIDGIDALDILTGVAMPIILLSSGLAKRARVDYIPTEACIDLEEEKVTITYPSLRRYINGPVQTEVYEYTTNYIRMFQYSSELNAIRIYGFPIITVGGKKDDSQNDDREIVVYLPQDRAEKICAEMERYLHLTAQRMDP